MVSETEISWTGFQFCDAYELLRCFAESDNNNDYVYSYHQRRPFFKIDRRMRWTNVLRLQPRLSTGTGRQLMFHPSPNLAEQISLLKPIRHVTPQGCKEAFIIPTKRSQVEMAGIDRYGGIRM